MRVVWRGVAMKGMGNWTSDREVAGSIPVRSAVSLSATIKESFTRICP